MILTDQTVIERTKIAEAFDKFGTDKGNHRHGYQYMYSVLFNHYLKSPFSILEIGIKRGKSLKAWASLFPNAEIVGIDRDLSLVDPDVASFPNITVIELDSRKNIFKDGESVPEKYRRLRNKFDLIIDDGSHKANDQVWTLRTWFNRSKYAYVIEDITGINNEKHIRSELKKDNFMPNIKELETYSSRLRDTEFVKESTGEKFNVSFFALLIVKNKQTLL